jgi:hypothetical protein
MKKIFLSFLISIFLSSAAFAFFDNKYFPSQDAKDECTRKAYNNPFDRDLKSDHSRKMIYENCIREYYRSR